MILFMNESGLHNLIFWNQFQYVQFISNEEINVNENFVKVEGIN